jgi:hypothetical protein
MPLISYGNWYFYHVQLGKFEEISDMTEYLRSCGQQGTEIDFDKTIDQYQESTEFALKAITELVKENIVPLANQESYSVIVSFCFTQIWRKNAFQLLTVYTEVLQTWFDTGFPRSLRNISEVFNRTASIPFETLRFATVGKESPIRALQHRTLALPSLLEEFINLMGYLPSGQEDIFSLQFLVLGLSCGDLRVSAGALDLYACAFAAPEPRAIGHLVESICLVARCWVTSHQTDGATKRIGAYLRAALRVCRGIVHSSGGIPAFLNLVVALLSITGDLLSLIIDEALTLFSDLIDKKCCEGRLVFDFRTITISAVLCCRNPRALFCFLIRLFDLPSEILSPNGDFALYLIIFAPLLCLSLDSPQALTTICDFDDIKRVLANITQHFRSSHISALLGHLEGQASQTFAFDLIHTLTPLTAPKTIEIAAALLGALVQLPFDCPVNGIFDLGCALLSVSSSKEVIDGLAHLTYEATLNEHSVLCASKIRFLQAISNCSDGSNIRPILLSRLTQSQSVSFIEQEFKRIQISVDRASAFPSPEKIYKIRFDAIETFPPIFPFEAEFLHCEIVSEVTNFCRRIQVNPQSNWAFSLYCATDISECKGRGESVAPDVNLDLHFSAILAKTVEEIIAEEAEMASDDEETEEKTADKIAGPIEDLVYSFGEGENRTHSVHMKAFLPDLAEIDALVGVTGFPIGTANGPSG